MEQFHELPPLVSVRLDDDVRTYVRRRLEAHTHDSYAGVPLQKFPEDLRTYEHLLWKNRPNVVIEVGTLHGAGALWFRDRLRTLAEYGRIGGDYQVITVDVDHAPALASLPAADRRWNEHIELVTGDIRDPEVVQRAKQLLPARARCFVVEDSAHEPDTTRAALDAFAELVPEDGYFVVEDGVVDVEELRLEGWPRGVLSAIDEWLETPSGSGFTRRRDLERYGVTSHPGGYLQRRSAGTAKSVDPALRAELENPPEWMYAWELGPGIRAPAGNVRQIVHDTRRRMLLPTLREALMRAGSEACVIDLGCNEGWFAHLALSEGAARAVGVDIRDVNIRRAELVRNHLGIAPDELQFRLASVFDLDPAELGSFDLTLVLGLVYHLENPGGALRVARSLTRPGGTAIVESQLTRQAEPIVHGWGVPDEFEAEPASFAARYEDDEADPLASYGGVVSLVPNRAALEYLMRAAGFEDGRWLEPPADAEPQYAAGDRGIFVARAPVA
jgi:cephalosporin hydroxylase/SAM-dependent methyltransferase